jgi:hypothetical protein
MLEIQDLKDLTIDDLVDLLTEEGAQPFEIAVPKSTQKFFSEDREIAIDYARLAYAGHRVHEISRSFEYTKIPPDAHESIIFTIEVADLKKLAETLLDISYGYINEPDDDELDYDDDVEGYLYDVEQGTIVPACPFFIDIYNEYISEEDEDDE